jgi:hypothetical protein
MGVNSHVCKHVYLVAYYFREVEWLSKSLYFRVVTLKINLLPVIEYET